MDIRDSGTWLTPKESLHLESVARDEGDDNIWQTLRTGNIAWLDATVPDQGFETPLPYANRFLARFMTAASLQGEKGPEPICIRFNRRQLRRLGAILLKAINEKQWQVDNFETYSDEQDKRAHEVYGDMEIPGVTDIPEEEKQYIRLGIRWTLEQDIATESRLLEVIRSHLDPRD